MKTPCEGRNLEEKNKLLQDLLNFTIPLTNSNGEHHKYGQHYKDVEHHDQGETFKQQKKKTVTTIQSRSNRCRTILIYFEW